MDTSFTFEHSLNTYAKKIREGAEGWNFERMVQLVRRNYSRGPRELIREMIEVPRWKEALDAIPPGSEYYQMYRDCLRELLEEAQALVDYYSGLLESSAEEDPAGSVLPYGGEAQK